MRHMGNQFYILSSENLDGLKKDLELYPTKEVEGCYTMRQTGEIIKEKSILVLLNDDDLILSLLQKHGQESALKVYPFREAELLFANGKIEFLGEFKPLDWRDLSNYENFTYCPKMDKFFVIDKI